MTAAIFGLLGVVIGALLSGLITLHIESRKERKEAMVAARFVHSELQMFQVDIENWIRDRYVPEDPDLQTEAWDQHSLALARGLPGGDWEMVAAGYLWVHLIRTEPRPGDLDDEGVAFYQPILTEVIGGVKTLEPLTEGMRPWVPWRIRRLRKRRLRKMQREGWERPLR